MGKVHAEYAGTLIVQKAGHADIPSVWPTAGVVKIVNKEGVPEQAKAIQSASGGNVYVHLVKDTDAAGTKTWTLVTLSATNAGDFSGTNEVAAVFDEIRETGTTIPITDLTAWL